MKTVFSTLFICCTILLSGQTWYQISPTTGQNSLNGISMLGNKKGLAVGDNGIILQYNGSTWLVVESSLIQHLNSIHYLATDKAWAVGDEGVILHFNGNEWLQQNSNTTAALYDVHFINENFGWAVGEAVLYYDGNEWQVVLEDTQLQAVHFFDETEGWAVGFEKIYKYGAGKWSVYLETSQSNFFTGIQMTGPATGWICGHSSEGSPIFMEYDGTNWQTAGDGPQPGYGLSFSDHNNGWVLNNQTMPLIDRNYIYNVTHGNWEKIHSTGWYGPRFTAVDAAHSGNAWATTGAGHVLQLVNNVWTTANGIAHEPIYSIDFFDSGKLWAASGINGLMYYEDGTWYTNLHQTDFDFTYVRFFGPEAGWAVASNLNPEVFEVAMRVYKYIAGNWAPVFEANDFAVAGPMYAIGENHARLFQSDPIKLLGFSPTGVEETLVPMVSDALAMYFSDYHTGWLSGWHIAVGKKGIILKYENGEWTTQYENPAKLINDFSFLENGTAYAVGEGGLILYYDGFAWSEIESPTGVDLTTIMMIDHQNGWAIGKEGVVLQFDVNDWRLHEQNLGIDLISIMFNNEGFGLIGGINGTLYATEPQLPVGIISPDAVFCGHALKLTPNPATTQAWLQLPENTPLAQAQIELYSPTGRLLYKAQPTSYFHKIDVALLPKGLYLVRVWDGKKWVVEKLVVG